MNLEALGPQFAPRFAVGAVISAGFLVVFGVAGAVITAGFRSVIDWIPWLALVIGAAVTLLGIAMLRGYEMTVGLPKVKRTGKGRGYGTVFGFGVSYAVASLSCTLPVFLTIVRRPAHPAKLRGRSRDIPRLRSRDVDGFAGNHDRHGPR